MATKAKKKVFFPKTRLAELAARAGGLTRDDAVDAAVASIEAMRDQADAEIKKSIAALEQIAFARDSGDTLNAAAMTSILKFCDQIVTLAGTFCYTALDTAARSLCDLADGFLRSEKYDRAPVAVHVQTIHLLAPGGMVLSSDHAEKLLQELAKVTDHFSFGSLAAAAGHDEFIAAVATKA